MQFGFSSYSFNQRLSTGDLSLTDVIDWVAASEGEHLELAVTGRATPEGPIPTIDSAPDYVASIKKAAADAGVALSQLAVSAEFFADPTKITTEIARVKAYVDLADRLGIRLVRHDVAHRNEHGEDDTPVFERALPLIVEAAQEIAQYAAARGITTSLENHGYFVQSSDRVRRVVHAVGEPNFKTTLDVGNFLCVDEEPTIAVPRNLPYASIVHLKDFYVREENPGQGWFTSRGGRYLRGAIVGNGDIDMRSVIGSIKESGYDGFVSIEFEGHEDCLLGCERGLANAARLYAAA